MKLFSKLIAQNPFGTVDAPPGSTNLGPDPVAGTGKFIGFLLQGIFVIAGLLSLAYMIWGALDWIISGGDKTKIEKAQQKITQAVIGLILVVVSFGVFVVIAGPALGIIDPSKGAFSIKIPTIGGSGGSSAPPPCPPDGRPC